MSAPRQRKSEKGEGDQKPGGEHYELSGDFRGAVINIKSTLVSAAEVTDIEGLPPEPGDPPFQGLQYYTEKDADRFFGREMLTARVAGRLKRTRFLAIIGSSGSGKSSLVRAGIIPAIKRGARLADGGMPPAESGAWAVEVMTPTAHPLDALAAALMKNADSVAALSTLQGELSGDPRTLTLATRKLLAQQSSKHLLLVIDQFEEIYTACRSTAERQAFVANLLSAVNPDDEQPITVMIVLRADFYAFVAQDDQLREMVSQYQEFIGAMNRDELVSAIDKPLALGGWKIQEGLIEVILDDVGYEPGALPLLSHALHETWRRRRGRTLTLSAYTETGGIRGAIAQTAESVFRDQLSPEQQPIARMIFLRMSELGEDAHDTRRRASFSELITRSTDELVIQTVINILVDARLVITGTASPGDTKIVEVAHEALIREWPTLRQWLAEDRTGLILHQNLAEDAEEWIKLDKDPGMLYRGVRLPQVTDWADKHPDMLSIQEVEFLERSRQQAEEERKQHDRLRRARQVQQIFAVVTLALVITISYLAYRFYFVKEPAVMDGLFNVAIASFPVLDPRQKTTTDPAQGSTDPGALIYRTVKDQLGENPNLLVWQDGSDLKDLNVEIGAIEGANARDRALAAAVLAERLGANVVIYPGLDASQSPATVALEFFLTPQSDDPYADIQGGFQVGSALPVSDLGDPDVQSELTRQASAMTWIALGLSEAKLGHSLEGLEAFLKASEQLPDSPVIQFFIGREYLFLVDREEVLRIARDEFEQQAKASFERAIELDPTYARAYVGLGSVYFKQAQQLLAGVLENPDNTEDPGEKLKNAALLAQEAITAYRRVIDEKLIAAETGLPIESIARLGSGNSIRLMGEIQQRRGDSSLALESFDRSIAELQQTVPEFLENPQPRYLAQAYEYLGSAYQWKGYSLEVVGDYENSLQAYQRSLEYYDQCIAQAETTQDLIISNEIVGGICAPNRSAVQEAINNLAGGQG